MAKKLTEYERINQPLSMHERGRGSCAVGFDWILNRIVWARKFGKITQEQYDELLDRADAHVQDYGHRVAW